MPEPSAAGQLAATSYHGAIPRSVHRGRLVWAGEHSEITCVLGVSRSPSPRRHQMPDLCPLMTSGGSGADAVRPPADPCWPVLAGTLSHRAGNSLVAEWLRGQTWPTGSARMPGDRNSPTSGPGDAPLTHVTLEYLQIRGQVPIPADTPSHRAVGPGISEVTWASGVPRP